jgi:NAD(P)-dependent dehydrogenase (short-subunit alcohol dehydrogenase family)
MKKTIIIVGAGKGLGNAIARKFGKHDFRVILIARSEAALKEYEEEFTKEGIEVFTHAADVAKPETLTTAFNNVKAKFGIPDVLVYNVGITGLDVPGTVNSEKLMQHYQIDVASAYHSVQQVVSEEFGKKNGVIILTGGGLALNPYACYTPLSLDKAALRAMAFLLHDELKPQGIFLGTVTIAGAITPNTPFAPELIAEKYWDMYNDRQEKEVLFQ